MLVVLLMLGASVALRPATAQDADPDATPASDRCAPLSRDEVVALTETYLRAIESGGALALDIILGDDVTHNFDDAENNEPGNDDEAALLVGYAGATFETTHLLVDDQTAIVRYGFTFSDLGIEGAAIVIITYECGQVADLQQESTELGRQVGLAEAAAGTPEP